MKLKILILPAIAILSIVGLCILLINCGPGNPDPCAGYSNEPKYFDIPAEDTLKIPYKGHETLRFQVSIDSQIIDTITLIGTGRVITYERFTPTNAPYACVTYLGESHTIEFKNSDSNSAWGNLGFKQYLHSEYYSTFEVNFRNINFIGSVFLIDDYDWGGYFPELKFNNIFYYKVTMVTDSKIKRIDNLKKSDPKLFISRNEGIIRMEIDSSEVWDLIN